MTSPKILLATALLAFLTISPKVTAHCQVPCGIYNDSARFVMLNEHITTIEKSMNQINELSASESKNMNQIVRWVNNKEDHANAFSEIVSYYFMAQRVKPVSEGTADEMSAYLKKVELLHNLIVLSMKCKQSSDIALILKLRGKLDQFEKAYFS